MQHLICRLWRQGVPSVVFNSRGTSDSPVTSPQFYSASYTGDTRLVAAHLRNKYPNAALIGVGWSLGANILLNYLGEEGDAAPLVAAVSLCNPFNLVVSNRHISRGFNRIYDLNLGKTLRNIFQKHRGQFEDANARESTGVLAEMVDECRTIRDFDEQVTHKVFGWDSVDDYYQGRVG